MAEIKYNGSTINSVVSQITNIAGKFDPVSNSVKTSTGVMVGRRGFDLINPGISADSISQSVGTCSEALGALVKEIRTKQVAILTYSQDKDEINAFVNSLSRLEYDNLDLSGIDSKISGWTKLSFAAKGLFASAGTFLTGFVEGAANFVETAVDTAAVVATGAASIFTKPYDLITGSNVTDEMWESTKAYVAEEQVASIADEFYANTEAGQWLKQNAYGFDTVRGIGKGVGYSTTMIMAGNVFAGAGGVDAAVKGARLAKALPAMSGVLGFGNGAEEGWANGATTEKGLMYGAAAGTWESIQWGVGVKIGSLGSHIDDIATVGAKQVFKDASKRVVLDTVDSGLEGFVQPALTMIYREYDGDTLAAQYANAFEANGGWNGVLQQAAIGGIMSGASEAGDVFKYNRNAAKIKKTGGSTGTDAKGSSSGGSGDAATKTTTVGGEKSDTVLKGDGSSDAEARVEVHENFADAVSSEVAASSAADTSSRKVNETTTKKPTDTTPSKPVEVTSSRPVDTTPKKPTDTTPSKPVEVSSSRPVDTTTKKPTDVIPSKPVEVALSKPVDTTLSKPVEVTSSRPVDTTPGKPVEVASSKPVDTTPSKPVEVTSSKPVDTTPSKPVEVSSSKPVEIAPVKSNDVGAGAKIESSGTQSASMAAGLSSLIGDASGGKISGADVSKAGVGVATMAGLGKLGTSMSAVTSMGSDVDIDVDVKFTGDTGATPTRTSRQLSGDLEKMSAAFPGKQAKVDAAEANLAKYKSEAGDAADPKVVKKLEGEVSRATADRDKQLEKMKNKAEQRSAAATREIDEKLASGSKKGLVGTEKGKLVDGEFTKDSAIDKGKISKKEFATEPATRDSLMKTEGADRTLEAKVAESGQTEVQPVSEDVRTDLGITDNETYDSLATKVDQAVADGKLTREQGDSLFDTIAEEQHFDTKEQIADLRRETAEYEQARRDNIERKDLLVTQDGAKPESVKGYDEAVRQIDEKIAANNAKIAELEAGMETKPDTPATEVAHEADSIVPENGAAHEADSIIPDEVKVTEGDGTENVDVQEVAPKVTDETPVTEVAHEADSVVPDEVKVTEGEGIENVDVQEVAPKVTEETPVTEVAHEADSVVPDEVKVTEGEGTENVDVQEVVPKVIEETPVTEIKSDTSISDDVRTEIGITDNETYDSLATKFDQAVADGKLTREQADSLFDTVAEEQHFDTKEQIADLRRETAEYEQARRDNIERKELLVTQDGAKPESVKGYDEAVRQIDEKIAANNAKIAELEAGMETKPDTPATEVAHEADSIVPENGAAHEADSIIPDEVKVTEGDGTENVDVQEVAPKVTEETPVTEVAHEADSIVPENEVDIPTTDDASIRPDGQTNEIRTETEVETNTRIDTDSPDDFKSKYGITDNEDYDSIMTKMDRAVEEGRISREDADSLIERVAEEQHFDAKTEIARLREENASYEKARIENVDRKGLLVTQDGAKPESVKGYDEAVRQIDEQIKINNAKIGELETEINTPVARLETDNPTTKLTTDSLSRDNVVEPEVVALGNAGAAAMATVGKLGGDITTKVTDPDVISKTTGRDSASTRTSKQLGADLEKLSAGLSDKQTKLDAAKANLDKYKSDMGDAADPKVVKKLEGDVAKAQTEYDKQLAKVKDKAEQRNAAAAREIDEKIASGSKKGLVGTEKGKVVDGEFTTDSAITKGEISKKEFATEPATRDSLMKTEGADGTSEAKVDEAGQTDVNPISDDLRTELGITDNETYDSLATKVDQAVAEGKLTREQADELFYKVAEEQKFDTQERISELRRENAEYEQARIDNVERKELLVTQDGAKPESVKGYDEAVRQIDERIKTNSDEIARLETSSETVRPDDVVVRPDGATPETRVETDEAAVRPDDGTSNETTRVDEIAPKLTEEDIAVSETDVKHETDGASNETSEVDEIAPKLTEEDIAVSEADDATVRLDDGTSNETTRADEIASKVTEEDIVVPEADDAVVRPDDGTSNETSKVDEIAPKVTEEDIVVPEADDATVRPDGAIPETRVETDDAVVRPDDGASNETSEVDEIAPKLTEEDIAVSEADDATVRPDDGTSNETTRADEIVSKVTEEDIVVPEADDAVVRPDDGTSNETSKVDEIAPKVTEEDIVVPEADDAAVRPDGATPETRVETDEASVRPDDGTSNETSKVDEIASKVTEEDIVVPEADDATVRPDGAIPEIRVETDDAVVRPDDGASNETTRVDEIAPKVTEEDIVVPETDDAAVMLDGAIPEIRTETDVVPVGADDASVKVPTEVSGVKPIEEVRFDSVQELAPITYSERLDLADDLCVHLGDDYAVGMHGIGMRSGDLDPNSVMSSIAKNGLNVKDGRTIHGTVEFFGKPGTNRTDVMSNINRYAYGGGDQVIVATPTTIRNSKGEMIYIGGPNTKSTVVDYRSGGYDTSSFADDCLVIDSKVPSEFVYGYFSDKPDGTVEFHPNPNHISRTGGIVSDEMFDFVQKKLRAEFNPALTKLLSAEPSPSMLASANEVYRKLEGLLADADDFSLFNNPADIRRDMETVLQYQSDCQGKIPGVDVTKQVGVDTTPVEVRTDSAVSTTEIKADTPVEARVETAVDVNVRPDEAAVRTEVADDVNVKTDEAVVRPEVDDAVVRTEVADDVNVRTEADDAVVRTDTDEQLARLTREHDAEVDRLKQKQEQEIDAATRDKNRQLAEEDARYQDEVARLRKQYETHYDDLSLHRSESEVGVKYTEGQLKQNYEKLYDERLYDLRQQHESRMADINDRGNATIRRIDNRYSEDIRVVDKMLQDVRTEVANGELAGSALGAKKLISDYDRFVRQQSEFEAERLSIMEKYNGQRANVESSYRGDMGALDRFHEEAQTVVRRGVTEPTYYLERAGLDSLCDRHNLENLEIFFDDESAFVRRLYEGDANYVLQTKDARLAAIDAKMDQELRDLELRYNESSGMDVTDPYKKYELAVETDLPLDRLKALSEELKMEEIIADLSDDTLTVQRLSELREGIDEKIGTLDTEVPKIEYDKTLVDEQPIHVDSSDNGINDDVVYGDSSEIDYVLDEKPIVQPPVNNDFSFNTRPDGTATSHSIEADGRVIDSDYNAKGELIGRTEKATDGSYKTYKLETDGKSVNSEFDSNGNLIKKRELNVDGSSRITEHNVDEKTYTSTSTDSKGNVTEKVWTDTNGTIRTEKYNSDGSYTRHTLEESGTIRDAVYDTDGNLARRTELQVDGTSREVHFDKDGNIKYDTIKRPDGSSTSYMKYDNGTLTTSLDASGNVIRTVETSVDGVVKTTDFDIKGNYEKTTIDTSGKVKEKMWTTEGTTNTQTFNADGSSTLRVDGKDGTFNITKIDSKGNITEQSVKSKDGTLHSTNYMADGTKRERIYHPDNTVTARRTNPDGSTVVTKFDSGKNMTERVETAINGTTTKQTFNTDGTQRTTVKDKDGYTKDYMYSSDGKIMSYHEGNPDGTFKNNKYDSSEKLIETISTGKDGSYTVERYNSDGSYTRHVTEANKVTIDSSYDKTGNLISRTKKHVDGTTSKYEVGTNGFKTDSVYDSNNKLIRQTVTEPGGITYVGVQRPDGVFETTKYALDTRVMQEVLDYPNGARVETNYNTDGSYVRSTQNVDKTFDTRTVDARGNIIERQWSSKDGTIRTQRPNGDGTYNRHTVAADGNIRDSVLDKDGLLRQTEVRPDGSKQTYLRNPDGSTKTTEYRTDGTTKVIDKFANGTSRITDRRADGSVKITDKYADGSSRINEKYADGTSKITDKKADGTYSSTLLDGKGRIIEESWSDIDGTIRTQKSNGDGTFSRHTVEASGRVRDSVLDKFDNLIRQTDYRTDGTRVEFVRNTDGTYNKTFLDKNGNRIGREYTDRYGTVRTERFNSDGTANRRTVKKDGTVSDTTFDINGDITYRVEKTPDGTTITTTRNSNGGRVVTEKYADGSSLRKTYDANNRLINQDVINSRGVVDHRTYNNPTDVRHRQQGQQPQADNKKSFMDRLRRQQPQVQQQMPTFRNAQEVVSSLNNPLNEVNLQKIASRLNDGQNIRPYEKIVTLNTTTPKTPPSLQAVGEFHSRFGIDRSKGYDTYYNSKGTRIHHQGEYFDHITSRGFNTGDVTDRLYLNIADYSQSYKFCELFAAECERRGIPYYFKTASAVDGNRLQPMQLKRDESIVIYSGKKYLSEYTNIASDIVSKYGFKLEDPPILTGKLKNNIGYGAEPNIDGESFNSIRSKIIDSSVRSLTADYRRRGLSINSSSYIRDLMRMIVERGSQCGIDMNNFCLNVE